MSVQADAGDATLSERALDTLERSRGSTNTDRLVLRWLAVTGICLVVIASIALVAALSLARYVMMPVVAGIIIGLIIGPIGDRGKRLSIPKAVTFTILVTGLLLTIYAATMALAPVFEEVVSAMPKLTQRLSWLSHWLQSWTTTMETMRSSVSGGPPQPGVAVEKTSSLELAATALSIVTPAVSQILILVFTLILFLAGRSHIRNALTLSVRGRDARLAALKTFSNVENQLTDYFLVASAINAVLGLMIAALFLALDVPGALRWGLVAFALNFLPVVGPLIMKASLLAFGLLFAPTLFEALAPISIFLLISLIEANLITPKIIGTRITMNPLLVFLSVIFWTWLWGPAGAFLAMPFLAIASVIIAEYGRAKVPHLPG